MAKPGKNNRKVKNRRRRLPQESIRKVAGLYVASHPFSRLDRTQLRGALIAHGREAAHEFSRHLVEVRTLLSRVHAPQALAMLASYGLVATVKEGGAQSRPFQGERFTQSHVELAQAIALQSDWSAEKPAPDPDDIQFLFDVLPELATNYAARRYVVLGEEHASADEKALLALQEHLRLHTQSVRNWGYFQYVLDTLKSLLKPMDARAMHILGYPLSAYVNFMDHYRKRVERGSTERFRRLREACAQEGLEARMEALLEAFPTDTAFEASLREFVRMRNVTDEEFKSLALQYSDRTMLEAFVCPIDEAIPYFGDRTRALDALDGIALAPGVLAGALTEDFFLANPVWTRPLVKLDDEHYFAAVPHAFFSFVLPIMDHMSSRHPQLATAWVEQRSRFLEEEIARVVTAAIPGASIARQYKWSAGSDVYENDLLVLIDSTLLIVEAKSGSVSWPALRGAPGRARKHFQELIVSPSLQSERLKQAIERAIADSGAASALAEFPFELSKIKSVLRLSVTLEDFAVMQSNVRPAVKAGWVPADHVLPPTLLLSDLQVVLDLLPTRAERIHYFKRRAEIQQTMRYVADELDLLGVYIANGFGLGGAEGGTAQLILTGMSKPIDDYFLACELGHPTEPPRRRLSPWWSAICETFETRGFYRWSEAAAILLDINFENQKKFEKKFEQIKLSVRSNWRNPDHRSGMLWIPPPPRNDAIVLFAYNDHNAEKRREAMSNLASRAFDAQGRIDRCLVLGVNIDRPGNPYSTMAIFERPRE